MALSSRDCVEGRPTMTRIISLIFALSITFGLASGAFADEAADKAFYDAFELLKAKKADAAIVKFDQGLKTDPSNATARFYLGEAHYAAGHPKRARSNWQRALNSAPNSEWAPQARQRLSAAEKIIRAPTAGTRAARSEKPTESTDEIFMLLCEPIESTLEHTPLFELRSFRVTIDLKNGIYMREEWRRNLANDDKINELEGYDDNVITLWKFSHNMAAGDEYIDRRSGKYEFNILSASDDIGESGNFYAQCHKVKLIPLPSKQF